MPSYRLLHANCRTGRRTKQLTDLEYLTWIAYLLSADDYGVCPASARKLQGDDPRLDDKPTKAIQRGIEKLVRVGLIRTFEDDGRRYLYQPDWQDWQRMRYPSASSYPSVPPDLLANCSEKTREMFSTRSREVQREHSRESSNENVSHDRELPTAKANANANASLQPSSTKEQISEGFTRFWEIYPKRKAKADALKAWTALKPDSELAERIHAAVLEQSQMPNWLKDQGQYVPFPASWLRARRWEDEADHAPQISEKNARTLQAIYGD